MTAYEIFKDIVKRSNFQLDKSPLLQGQMADLGQFTS